jgi:hypothetical protein
MRILSIGTLDESVHHDSRAWMIEDIALVQATATIIMQGQPFPCFPSPVIDQICPCTPCFRIRADAFRCLHHFHDFRYHR